MYFISLHTYSPKLKSISGQLCLHAFKRSVSSCGDIPCIATELRNKWLQLHEEVVSVEEEQVFADYFTRKLSKRKYQGTEKKRRKIIFFR
jgi:hypothetical protein